MSNLGGYWVGGDRVGKPSKGTPKDRRLKENGGGGNGSGKRAKRAGRSFGRRLK